jgi:hypothetical protein
MTEKIEFAIASIIASLEYLTKIPNLFSSPLMGEGQGGGD